MQLHLVNAVISGFFLALFMAISVGPTLFAIIKYSLEYSYKAGLAFVLGVSLSDILYVCIANFAASWLRVLEAYKTNIAYGGASILIIAGILGLINQTKPNETITTNSVSITKGDYIKVWSSGFLINTINPGVFISWLTAVTATANTSSLYRFTLFGTCLVLILSIDFMKVFLADKIRTHLTPKLVLMLQKISSLVLMILGIVLIATTYFSK